MLILLLLQAATAAAPLLSEVRALPPAAAGERVLAGREHGPIAEIRSFDEPPGVPGVVELDLFERGRPVAGGCLRGRWRANFQHRPGEARDTARFADAYRAEQVALAKRGGCDGAAYAHLNPGIPVETALAALARLDRLVRSPGRTRIGCRSSIDPALCASRRGTLRAIAPAPVWGVLGSPDAVQLLLGERRQPPITVTFTGADAVEVTKEIPPPF